MKKVLFACLLMAGCSGTAAVETPSGGGAAPQGEPPSMPAPSEDPELKTVVELAQRIQANPAAAEQILTESGYTLANYEQLLVEIASDPGRSAAYAAAMGE